MRIVLVIAGSLIFLGGIFYYHYPQSEPQSLILLGDKAGFSIEIADEPHEVRQGLSDRESLAVNAGVLFVFDQAKTQHFWMYNMNFPLDFVWINEGRVIGLDENIPHPAANGGEIYRLSSPDIANMVLEINSGLINRYGLEVGDPVNVVGLTD